jgi:hypothetical protein
MHEKGSFLRRGYIGFSNFAVIITMLIRARELILSCAKQTKTKNSTV